MRFGAFPAKFFGPARLAQESFHLETPGRQTIEFRHAMRLARQGSYAPSLSNPRHANRLDVSSEMPD